MNNKKFYSKEPRQQSLAKKIWLFIWEDDSILSWVVNVILAFILVKFVIYPVLGFMLGTGYPIVAVISSSMEHRSMGFDSWWENNKGWYLENDIAKGMLSEAKFKNGFNKGDIIILVGKNPEDIKKMDVVVYSSDSYKYPIIHRVVQIDDTAEVVKFTTKGDNNPISDPAQVRTEQLLGKAVFRIPKLGWVKILFTELIGGM